MNNLEIFVFNSAFYTEYFSVFLTLLIGLALASIISGASYFLSRQASDPEKLSPYECGFEPFEDARNTFDIRFYLVAILFILFDAKQIPCVGNLVTSSKLNAGELKLLFLSL